VKRPVRGEVTTKKEEGERERARFASAVPQRGRKKGVPINSRAIGLAMSGSFITFPPLPPSLTLSLSFSASLSLSFSLSLSLSPFVLLTETN
jgi:hypothetical protein